MEFLRRTAGARDEFARAAEAGAALGHNETTLIFISATAR